MKLVKLLHYLLTTQTAHKVTAMAWVFSQLATTKTVRVTTTLLNLRLPCPVHLSNLRGFKPTLMWACCCGLFAPQLNF